jgi:hypothetical protein
MTVEGLLTELESTLGRAKNAESIMCSLGDERDKFERLYKLAIKEHLSLGKEMTLRRTRDEAQAELEVAREDVRLAAGELLVDMADAPPGSLVARLLIANRIMSRERDDYKRMASSRATLVREKRRLILAQRERIAKLEKLARCDSVDPSTGYQCEFRYGHTTDLHAFDSHAWPNTAEG